MVLLSSSIGMEHFPKAKHVTEQCPSAKGLSFLLMVGLPNLGISAKAIL